MSQSGIDPFERIRGYTSQPNANSQSELSPYSLSRPYVRETVRVENFTNTGIATYSRFGVRTYIPHYNDRVQHKVRVELTIVIPQSVTIDYLAFDFLMFELSEQQRESLTGFLHAQESTPNSTKNSRTLNIYWDIPHELLKHSPHGVLIESIGQVIQLWDNNLDRSELHHAGHQPPPLNIDTEQGLMGTFNKHDAVVKGIWVNIKGTVPIKICDNLNDTSLPEGLSVLMNGEWQKLRLDELSFHGFYLTPMQAMGAHTSTIAEQTTAHKQFIADQEKQIDREEKKTDKEYERAEKRSTQEYERLIKEDERVEKRTDRVYDRTQTLIDKKPMREMAMWNSKYTRAMGVITMITAVIKVAAEIKKHYDNLADK